MFDNISRKIKILAYVCTIVGILASLIIGVEMLNSHNSDGMTVMILGSFISWVTSFTLYGFGQLIENTDIIANKFSDDHKNEEKENSTADKIAVITALRDDDLISEEEYREKLENLKDEK